MCRSSTKVKKHWWNHQVLLLAALQGVNTPSSKRQSLKEVLMNLTKITIFLLVENSFFFKTSWSCLVSPLGDTTLVFFITEAFPLYLRGASALWPRSSPDDAVQVYVLSPAGKLSSLFLAACDKRRASQRVQSVRGRRCPRGGGQR